MSRHASPARRAAHQVLVRIVRDKAFADRALDAALSRAALSRQDRGLATELVYGVLRHTFELDFHVQQLATKPVSKLPPEVRMALNLGTYQILHTRVPTHSAVNESVNLLEHKHQKLRGVVNGILRQLARQHAADQLPNPTEVLQNPVDALCVQHSHPRWLLDLLLQQWSVEQVRDFCAANNTTPPLCLRVNLSRAQREDVAAMLRAAGITLEEPSPELRRALPELLLVRGGGDVRHLPGFEEGLFSVQDSAAMLVGKLAPVVQSGWYLDACAAPGGKTTHLAEQLRSGNRVLALDIHPGKVRRIEQNAQRLRLRNVEPIVGDATDPQRLRDILLARHIQGLAGALVDAPCSGLGTLRRAPERRLHGPPNVQELTQLQDRLLDTVAPLIQPGGWLIYAVCTVTDAEGPQRIDRFLREHPEFALHPPKDEGLAPFLVAPAVLHTLPSIHGTDGFFAACFVRRSAL